MEPLLAGIHDGARIAANRCVFTWRTRPLQVANRRLHVIPRIRYQCAQSPADDRPFWNRYAAVRVRHYSIRTEQRYIQQHVAASTQNQALNALVFLYKAVLERPLGDMRNVVRAKRPDRIPVVLTPEEVGRVLRNLDGIYWLVACAMYGSGLRLMEALRLRVKDIDFDHRAIVVRDGKGGSVLDEGLRARLAEVRFARWLIPSPCGVACARSSAACAC